MGRGDVKVCKHMTLCVVCGECVCVPHEGVM